MTGDMDGTGDGEALEDSICRLTFERRLFVRFSTAVDDNDDDKGDVDE